MSKTNRNGAKRDARRMVDATPPMDGPELALTVLSDGIRSLQQAVASMHATLGVMQKMLPLVAKGMEEEADEFDTFDSPDPPTA